MYTADPEVEAAIAQTNVVSFEVAAAAKADGSSDDGMVIILLAALIPGITCCCLGLVGLAVLALLAARTHHSQLLRVCGRACAVG